MNYKLEDLPEGPWSNEPLSVPDWQDEATELRCRVRRNSMYAWCGYVELPSNLDADSCDFNVHGGVTFDGPMGDINWVGFDCCHHMDVSPGMLIYDVDTTGTYRTLDYVLAEVRQLAIQIRKADLIEQLT